MICDPVRLTDAELERLRKLIAEGKEHEFYTWPKWHAERAFVLREDRNECQTCKAKGRYSRAVIVHHVKHLRNRPELALLMFAKDDRGKTYRQLLSVCKKCHEKEHPEWARTPSETERFETVERWD